MRTMFLAIVLAAGLSVVYAQPPGEGRGFERIERFKKMRMVEMLDMTEDQSVRFFSRYNDFENTRRDLMKQRDEVLDKIERLLRNNADAKEYEKPFADVEMLGKKIADEKQKFFDGLGDLLSIEQRAKLLLFERRFENELRDAVRESQQRRRGRFGEN